MLSDKDRNIIAALYARSNMGQLLPAPARVARLKAAGTVSLDSAVNCVCEEFMEADEHYKIFMQEAKSWKKELKTDEAGCRRNAPDIFKLYEEAK